MSPRKAQVSVHAVKGPATVMKLNKDSHSIDKTLDSGTILPAKSRTKRQPVIIYTHSPEIIHAKARDFMSVVQKLTGFSPPKLKRMEEEPFSDEKEGATSSISTDDRFNHESVWHDDGTYNFDGGDPLGSNESFLHSSRANNLLHTQSLGGWASTSIFMDFMKGFQEC